MPRLIDADKLRKDILDLPNCYNGYSDTYDKATIVDMIDDAPTVDAVPVIRCKDCKYYQHKSLTDDEWNWCMQWHNYTDENVYCSLAERKEE